MSEQIFQCPECGMHYRDETIAKACQEFCSKHKACSLDIAKHAIENEVKA